MTEIKRIEYATNRPLIRMTMGTIVWSKLGDGELPNLNITRVMAKTTGNIPSRLIHYVANATPFKLLDATVVEYNEFDSPVTAIIDIEYDIDIKASGEDNMQVAQDAIVMGTI